ncbi:MAG: response regulator transcription factor [Actinomycetota bacterium]|nr:response regulator transcription factor [Actinomycetota bacterium]
MMVRVLLVDDQTVVRTGFRTLLELTDDLEVVGEADTGQAAVATALATRPDVVLMDIRMPGMDGIEATRHITSEPALASTRVLVLTTFEIDEYVFESLRAGASGFLLKDVDPADLHAAIRTVAAGNGLLDPNVTRRVIEAFARQAPPGAIEPDRVEVLTDRERQVVALVARGYTNQEIADELFMSPLTAKTHVSRAMIKLAARDRVQLAIIGYETGLASIGRLT